MKLQVTQENFAKALNNVARVANSRSTLPILSNVLIKTIDNRVAVAATNLDIAITQFVGSKIAKPGSITVPARLTQEFVSTLPGGVVSLDQNENRLSITTDKYESTINGVAADEFPVMPQIEGGQTWSVGASVLKAGLQEVIVAAGTDDARPVLTGVYLHTTEGSLYAVATDSYRLAEKKIAPLKTTVAFLVPATAISDLLRLMTDFDGEVVITHDDQQVLFKAGDTELVARLIEGKYPDYEKLIPRAFATTTKLKRSELANITKVSSLFARESAGSITIQANSKNSTVSIRSIASQLGENTAEADAEVTGGGEITLNARYLLDALHVIDGDEVLFCFNGKLEPCVIKSASSKSSYVHIIMPLKS